MSETTQFDAVARLSGFLYGISAFSGKLREYESFSFAIETGGENHAICELVNGYYAGQHEFRFQAPEILTGGTGELERCIRAFLIRDSHCIKEDRISDLQEYLSFRVMDMIEDIFGDNNLILKVFKLRDESASPSSESVFYCVLSSNLLLVLQFNDYSEIRS